MQNWYPLCSDLSLAGDVSYKTEADRKAAWEKFGSEIMQMWPDTAGTAGQRPDCWWRYDSPEPSNDNESSADQLRRMGELTAREEEILRSWEVTKQTVAAERTAAIEAGAGV